MYIRSVLIGLFLGLTVTISYGVGFISRGIWNSASTVNLSIGNDDTGDFVILQEVDRLINAVYFRELPDPKVREYDAIRGLLGSLNEPATFFIEPPVAMSESQALAGTYGGIGIQVKRLETGDFALFPFSDGPAAMAGISDNDVLVAVNGVNITTDLTIDEIDQLLRGEVVDDNGVTLTVIDTEGDSKDIFVKFDVINVPSVISRLSIEDNTIGYVQILKFTSRTPDELREKLLDLKKKRISALILDLRNNSGGLLVESIEVTSQFLDSGIVVIEKSRNSNETFMASEESILPDIPIVILINDRTASAAELVAGALRDNGRGVLLGQPTFGKGTVQQIFPLSDGSSIHVTSAEWFTPNEQSISANGLQPDIPMIADENNRDVEFPEAIRYLQSVLNKQSK